MSRQLASLVNNRLRQRLANGFDRGELECPWVATTQPDFADEARSQQMLLIGQVSRLVFGQRPIVME